MNRLQLKVAEVFINPILLKKKNRMKTKLNLVYKLPSSLLKVLKLINVRDLSHAITISLGVLRGSGMPVLD